MASQDWHHNFIDVNGITIHAVRAGDPAKPSLLLLHGWPEFWFTWSKIIPALAADYDVIAPDLRGFGDTEKPAGAALESFVEDSDKAGIDLQVRNEQKYYLPHHLFLQRLHRKQPLQRRAPLPQCS